MIAETTLADKISFPERVSVQNFSSDRHENALSEVSLLAEAAIDHTVRVNLGNETSERLVDIVPIYPVSRQSFPLAKSILNPARPRPVSREDASKIADRNAMLARIEDTAVGILVFEAAPTGRPHNVSQLFIGEGLNGPLVDATGVRLGTSAILERAADPLAKHGVVLFENALVVSPYLHGRTRAGDIVDYSALRITLFSLSAFMIAFGLASLFSLLPKFKEKKKADRTYQVKAVGAFPVIDPFQPIADQADLGESDEAPKSISRVLTSAAETFRSKSRQ
ncbi:MAG: hypothetical protein HKN27_04830 [Silicimonas sp.]|nr:hypothetical protein [Silicimonas sp.]